MLTKIKDIKTAVQAKAYLSALALSLTIPDVCGKLLYPGDSSKSRYTKWYQLYLPDFDRNFFSAENCYVFRCAYLHAGEGGTPENVSNIDVLTLSKDFYITLHESNFLGRVTTELRLDVPQFCKVICDAAEKFYNEKKNELPFSQVEIHIAEYPGLH